MALASASFPNQGLGCTPPDIDPVSTDLQADVKDSWGPRWRSTGGVLDLDDIQEPLDIFPPPDLVDSGARRTSLRSRASVRSISTGRLSSRATTDPLPVTRAQPRISLADDMDDVREALWATLEDVVGRHEQILLRSLRASLDSQVALLQRQGTQDRRSEARESQPPADVSARPADGSARPRSASAPGLLESEGSTGEIPASLEPLPLPGGPKSSANNPRQHLSRAESIGPSSSWLRKSEPQDILAKKREPKSAASSKSKRRESSAGIEAIASRSRSTAGSEDPAQSVVMGEKSQGLRNYKEQQMQMAQAARESGQELMQYLELRPKRGSTCTLSKTSDVQQRMSLDDLVKSPRFEAFFSVMIFANMVHFGVEVQYAAVHLVEEPPSGIWMAGQFFSVCFAVELLLRIGGQRRSFCESQNILWNALDSFLVMVSLIEVLFEKNSTLKYIRIIRIAKMLRLFRLVRLLRFFRSLRLLIYAIVRTLRALCWTMLLLTIILYCFSIMFTQATTQYLIINGKAAGSAAGIKNGDNMIDYFGSVWASGYTLFMSIAGGISWGLVMEPLGQVGTEWTILFLLYICFTYFAVLNVVTGVFCQTAIESATQDAQAVLHAQQQAKSDYCRRLTDLFAIIDADNLGKVTLGAFHQSLSDERVQAFFASMDLSVSDAWEFFKLLDRSGAHVLDIEEFVTGCLHLRGAAGKVDVASLRYEVHWMMQGFEEVINQHYSLMDASRPATPVHAHAHAVI